MAAVSDVVPTAVETDAAPATPAPEASKSEQAATLTPEAAAQPEQPTPAPEAAKPEQQKQQQEQQPPRQTIHARRLRPSDLTGASTGSESRIPLRVSTTSPQKVNRRESRLGLRSLFSRNKPADPSTASCASPTASVSSTGTGLWSRPFHSARSELALLRNPTISETVPASAPPQASANQMLASPASSAPSKKTKPTKLASSVRGETPSTPRTGRRSLATWDPPPLFQAYPQAIKQAQLPVCKISVEALIRFQGSRGNTNVPQPTASAPASDAGSQVAVDKDGSAAGSSALGNDKAEKDKAVAEKTKRKHRRDQSASSIKLDWQNKIYILVTSGYLLQYAGEGSFDRLPEKILHITKDSAAFASDLIPGRHWVLQVCSAMDADGTAPTSDSRSLFSRLPFRGYERRLAATFLLVFDNAEEMESWLTTLRREIEQLGGKKHLSETGAPKMENVLTRRSTQSSQRTLVVRDPERFSRLITPQDLYPLSPRSPRAEFSLIPVRDRKSDEMSATNSICSHDGRQLEGLRNSGNRFSYISSGQRTMVASESSSPPSSPNHGSFSSNPGDEKPAPPPKGRKTASQSDRRPSTQQLSAGQRTAKGPAARKTKAPPPQARVPISAFTAARSPGSPPPIVVDRAHTGHILSAFPLPPTPPAVPNFSVPHLSSRRFSLASLRSTGAESTSAPSPPLPPTKAVPAAPVARRGTRRMPPPSLVLPRTQPVKRQPSPAGAHKAAPRKPSTVREVSTPVSPDSDSSAPNTAALFSPWDAAGAKAVPGQSKAARVVSQQTGARKTATAAIPSMGPSRIQAPVNTSPRRHSSMMALRTPEAATAEQGQEEVKCSIQAAENVHVLHTTAKEQPEPPTAKLPAMPPQQTSVLVQLSSSSTEVSRPASAHRHTGHGGAQDGKKGGSLDSGRSRLAANLGPSKPLPAPPTAPPGQRLRSRSTSSRLSGRHSMYQLVDGPPPAPPPTCALPPLPPKTEERDNQAPTIAT